MARTHVMPLATSPVVDGGDRLTLAWQRYLSGLEDVSKRTATPVADLAGGATLGDTITAVNALLAALRASNQMDT